MSGIRENIAAVRQRMAAAAERAGRSGEEILLVGASKMNDAGACREAIAAGIDALGENRVQELLEKDAQGAYEGAPLHFIGHLQRNKVRQIVGRVDLIHSVSSLELLEEIQKQAEKRGVVQRILLEVNVGGEESKSGFAPEDTLAAAERAAALPNLSVEGLMTIPPIQTEPHGNLPYFEKIYRLYIDIGQKVYDNKLKYLSMGMSDDFEDAIAAGATVVRVGSAIFGMRHYTT